MSIAPILSIEYQNMLIKENKEAHELGIYPVFPLGGICIDRRGPRLPRIPEECGYFIKRFFYHHNKPVWF